VGDATRWYELSFVDRAAAALLCAAADRLVQAETALRDFMQTLTKTFAQLPIGLAIFDGSRAATVQPGAAGPDRPAGRNLIARPTLSGGSGRDARTLDDPRAKGLPQLARRSSAMEEAAASGLFEDTWTLPSGQTYRVTGRPHPNGALAFLFEDISTEMMRTRRYRADLEMGQAVIDAMDEAVAVFSHDGNLVMTNRAYGELWGKADSVPPVGMAGLAEVRHPATIDQWRSLAAPTLLWNDLTEYIGALGARDPWDGEVRLLDGRLVGCKVSPMPHGATLVSFSVHRARTLRPGSDEDGAARAMLIA
jgi:PAS domain-containing protein